MVQTTLSNVFSPSTLTIDERTNKQKVWSFFLNHTYVFFSPTWSIHSLAACRRGGYDAEVILIGMLKRGLRAITKNANNLTESFVSLRATTFCFLQRGFHFLFSHQRLHVLGPFMYKLGRGITSSGETPVSVAAPPKKQTAAFSRRDPNKEVSGQAGFALACFLLLVPAQMSFPDSEICQAHISLKKTWAAHFNMWVNANVDRGPLGSLGAGKGRLHGFLFDFPWKRNLVAHPLIPPVSWCFLMPLGVHLKFVLRLRI